MSKAIDPVTFAVIKNAMDAIVDEVAYTVLRTARSEIVKDVMDYSAAICDAQGRMIAQAKTIALHLGAIPEAMEQVLARYGNDLVPGDAVILNEPYQGGDQLNPVLHKILHLPERALRSQGGCAEQRRGVSLRRYPCPVGLGAES